MRVSCQTLCMVISTIDNLSFGFFMVISTRDKQMMDETPHFQDYFWSNGKPRGVKKTTKNASLSFRIIVDPYHKRYSVERYHLGHFKDAIYDSNLFDFRHLKKGEEAGWQREILKETPHQQLALIRNIEERAILIEEAEFQEELCRTCKILSPHGIWIATQKMLHRSLGDDFDGVALLDILDHPILVKHYEKSPKTGEFGKLLDEVWDHTPSGPY